MLNQIGNWNNISQGLRDELEAKLDTFGKRVRFKFHISHENPDREKYNGPIIWPAAYALDPITFRIVDPHEKRPGVSKSKLIGLIDEVDETTGKEVPKTFHRIWIRIRHEGKLSFDLESPSDRDFVMYLLLHPKLIEGAFKDKNKKQMFERIDEKREAVEGRKVRSIKREAMAAAEEMSDQQVKDFAAAMTWDETEEIAVLRNRIEEESETNPDLFIDLIKGKKVEYRALVKNALDRAIISYDPAAYKVLWSSNQQLITVLGPSLDEKNDVERIAEWLMTGGKKADAIHSKIKELSKS